MSRFSIFLDVSGRVTRTVESDDQLVIAAVVVDSDEVANARECLNPNLPKWVDCSVSDLEDVVEFLRERCINYLVIRVEKTQPLWDEFFEDGKKYHAKIANQQKSRLGVFKPANVLKFRLFGECASRASVEALKVDGWPKVVDQFGHGIVEETIVCDSDIQGQKNEEFFRDIWNKAEKSQRLENKLGLARFRREVKIRSEIDELLLLLPDYLAGLWNCSTNRECKRPAAISVYQLRASFENLRRKSFIEEPFRLNYRDIFGGTRIGKKLWGSS